MLLDSSLKHRDSCILGPLEITASGRRGEGDSKFLNSCPKNMSILASSSTGLQEAINAMRMRRHVFYAESSV